MTCKLLEHIVDSNIRTHLDKHQILIDAQHGFRQKKSCESQLITTIRDFTNCLDRKEQIDAILLDFSKAFDKVDHQILISKLHNYGIQHSTLNWLKSFLSNREQTVVVDGSESSPLPVLSGVPQGTVLGPLLFLVYINDISADLSPGTKIRLFADDSLLYRTISTPDDSRTLQKDLDVLQNWETANKMEFHPGKCENLRITNLSTASQIKADYKYTRPHLCTPIPLSTCTLESLLTPTSNGTSIKPILFPKPTRHWPSCVGISPFVRSM